MQILPPQTVPPTEPTSRRHSPSARKYAGYKPCLRWEFGFTCAFCLLHEADLAVGGVLPAGNTAVMWIEHLDTQKGHPALKDQYTNCVWSCRFCNRSRHFADRVGLSARLLNPCEQTWSSHFVRAGDELRPHTGDTDAEHTHQIYDLDDPRKVRLRAARREYITEALRTLAEVPARELAVLALAAEAQPSDALRLIEAARELHTRIECAARELERWAAVPSDAPDPCCCDAHAAGLPAYLAAQVIDAPTVP